MVTERQKAFRQEYRSRIMGWYDGYLHIVIIYAMGAAAFAIYLQHIHDVTPAEWLTIPVTFLFTNLFEWAVHRFVMHRPDPIQGPARHLRAPHAQPPPVLHRRGDALPRPQGLARDRVPALRAGRVHPDVDAGRRSSSAICSRPTSAGCSCARPRACT